MSRKGGTGGGGWGHQQGAVHMAAARLGLTVKGPWVALAASADLWALSGCLPTENADHCMLVNEWVWVW